MGSVGRYNISQNFFILGLATLGPLHIENTTFYFYNSLFITCLLHADSPFNKVGTINSSIYCFALMAFTSAASSLGRLLDGPVDSCLSPGKSEAYII